MGLIRVHIDTQAAVRAGRLASGVELVQVSDEQVAALSQEQRDTLAAMLEPGEPPTLRNRCRPSPSAQLAAATWEAIVAHVDAQITEQAQQEERRLVDEQERQEHREQRVQEILADWHVLLVDGYVDGHSSQVLASDWSYDVYDDPRIADQLTLARAEADRCRTETKENIARWAAEKAAQEEAEEKERADWIAAHGSERLRRAVRLGLADSIDESYLEERLAMERPGWRPELQREERGTAIEPSDEALTALEAARAQWRNCTLVWLKTPRRGGCEALGDTHLGSLVVYEVPGGRDTRHDEEEY